jgi:hypothetical protein
MNQNVISTAGRARVVNKYKNLKHKVPKYKR